MWFYSVGGMLVRMLIRIVCLENEIKQAATNRRRPLIHEGTCMGGRTGPPLKLRGVFPIKQRNCETSSLKANVDVTNYVMYFQRALGSVFPGFSRGHPFPGERGTVVKQFPSSHQGCLQSWMDRLLKGSSFWSTNGSAVCPLRTPQ